VLVGHAAWVGALGCGVARTVGLVAGRIGPPGLDRGLWRGALTVTVGNGASSGGLAGGCCAGVTAGDGDASGCVDGACCVGTAGGGDVPGSVAGACSVGGEAWARASSELATANAMQLTESRIVFVPALMRRDRSPVSMMPPTAKCRDDMTLPPQLPNDCVPDESLALV
jgi:hypothetical protein